MTFRISNFLKALIILFLIFIFLFQNLGQITGEIEMNNDKNQNTFADFIPDEIEPYCDGSEHSQLIEMTLNNIKNIEINFKNKASWYENFVNAYMDDPEIILDKYKNRFDAQVVVNFSNDFLCTFNAKVRISGDFKDHLRSDMASSLDIHLNDGNIENITKFKLFLPETRRMETEFITSEIVRELGFLTPRTHTVMVSLDGQKEISYIFQEKAVKEFLEFNDLREGPLLETSEEYFWQNRKKLDSGKPIVYGKILNLNWTNLSNSNQKISLEALGSFNQLISQSGDGYLIYDHKNKQFETLRKFDTVLYALDGNHGLAIHNRKFFYDNYAKNLVPVYYDIDSQIVSRDLEFPKCSEKLKYDYQYTSCINNFSETAQGVLNEINFDSKIIYENLKSKNIFIEFELIDLVLNKFLLNLKSISLMGNINIDFDKKFVKNFQNNYLEYINTPNINFYFLDLENKFYTLCESYLNQCVQSDVFNETMNNDIKIEQKTYHLIEFDFNINNQYTTYYLNEDIYLRDFGNSKITVDKVNKVLNIDVVDSKRFLITGEGFLSNWTINLNGNLNNEISSNRQDDNSLTGCLTIYNINITEMNIFSNNNNCEDAINLLNVTGSLNQVEITNSYFDALDIDFSTLEIDFINIKNSGNDCLDISFSEINIKIAETILCDDKAVSIGEKSIVNIRDVLVNQSNIGIAVKDSSVLNINSELNIQDSNYCLTIYNKKQEFGSSYLYVTNYYCESIFENFIQRGSEVIFGQRS